MFIENQKTYTGKDLETIFFRPSFSGKSAEELGIRVIYNMPLPLTVPVMTHTTNILQPYSSGWSGGTTSNQTEREIVLNRVKAESSYSAADYFTKVCELITNSPEVNLGDLTGTDLEKAETEIFRRAIADDVYATTWVGDQTAVLSNYTTFDGFLPTLIKVVEEFGFEAGYTINEEVPYTHAFEMFRDIWQSASSDLRASASEGNLAFFVSSDIYDMYHFALDDAGTESSHISMVDGRSQLYYHGIPVVEIPLAKYGASGIGSFCILTDRRNLILALNTSSSPDNEVRMWYNPDEMENRQRAVFLAGTAILDFETIAGFIVHNKE